MYIFGLVFSKEPNGNMIRRNLTRRGTIWKKNFMGKIWSETFLLGKIEPLMTEQKKKRVKVSRNTFAFRNRFYGFPSIVSFHQTANNFPLWLNCNKKIYAWTYISKKSGQIICIFNFINNPLIQIILTLTNFKVHICLHTSPYRSAISWLHSTVLKNHSKLSPASSVDYFRKIYFRKLRDVRFFICKGCIKMSRNGI